MKKLFALLLALAMLLSCLAGCAAKDETPEETPKQEQPAEQPEAEPEQKPEELPEDVPAEEPEQGKIDIGGLVDAIGEADGDWEAIIGILGEEFGDEIMAELETLGVSEYVGMVDMAISGDITLGTYEQLLLVGAESTVAPETVLPAGTISEEFEVQLRGAAMTIRVANPTEADIPMGSGVICYCKVESTVLESVGGFVCGTATREDVLQQFGAPYEAEEDSLTYHTTAKGSLDWGAVAEKLGIAEFDDDLSRTITFLFEDGVLVGVIMEAPFYVYGGLEDNVDEEELDDLEELTPEQYDEIVETRDTILTRLVEELETRGIDADVDLRTGEIILGDTILFANNSVDLTAEGKAYLDGLFAAYAAVVLDEAFAGKIDCIRIEGHASPVGAYDYNLALSQLRAEAVRDYCLVSTENGLSAEQKSALESLMVAEGYSFTDPVYDENGEVDNTASRRVAIKFFVTIPE